MRRYHNNNFESNQTLTLSHVTSKKGILLGSYLKCVYMFDLVAILRGYIRIYTEFSKWDVCCWYSVAFKWLLILSLASGTLGFTGSDGATEAKRRIQRKTWPRTWTTPQPGPAWRRAACLRIVRAELDAPFDLKQDHSEYPCWGSSLIKEALCWLTSWQSQAGSTVICIWSDVTCRPRPK